MNATAGERVGAQFAKGRKPHRGNGHPKSSTPPALFRPIADIVAERREPEWLPGLHKILEGKVLAVMAGKRSTFKSFIMLHWAMTAAVNGAGVAILSGEGAGLDRRVEAWRERYSPEVDLAELHTVAIEQPRNLNDADGRAYVSDQLADLSWPVDLVVVDTMSKFSAGLDENSNAEVAEFLAGLSIDIRDRLRCTVLLVVHTGHGEQSRPRGASALMANPDAEYIVKRHSPLASTVTVTRERFKDCAALPPLAYEAHLVHLGREDRHGEPVTTLVLTSSDAPNVPPGALGCNQRKAMQALREWRGANPKLRDITSAVMKGLLDAKGLDRKRQGEVLRALVNLRVLTPVDEGYRLDLAML